MEIILDALVHCGCVDHLRLCLLARLLADLAQLYYDVPISFV